MTALQSKRILLIGGAGFIGHNLALVLTRLGAHVQVLDSLAVNNLLCFAAVGDDVLHREHSVRFIHARLDLLRQAGVTMHIYDARDERWVRSVFETFQPEIVVQLAGISHAVRCNSDPNGAFEHTLRTLQTTLNCCRGSEHLVFFSSSMVYGHFNGQPVTEETPCQPLGIYGALKFAGEKMVIAHSQVTGQPYTIIRPSALYGERCVSRRVVQVFVENALQGRDLTVNGSGDDRLDFTYIDDLVDGLTRVMRHEEAHHQVFNLTCGCGRSISEVADLLAGQFPGIQVVYQPKDRLMPERGTLCVDKARNLLGYDPQYPLERGLAKYVWWYRSLGALSSPMQVQRRAKVAT